MKSLFVAASSFVLMLPVIAQSQEMDKEQQARFLRIELESYYKSYANACDNLRELEQQVAVYADEAVRGEEISKQREKLEAHLADLRKRANAAQQSIVELTQSDEHPHLEQGSAKRKLFLRNLLEPSGRELDVGIDGDGYFRAFDLVTQQAVFTRVGSFDIDSEGHLILTVASKKLHLRPAILVPENAISLVFNDDGTVLVRLPGSTELRQIGQLELVIFERTEQLLSVDEGLFIQTLHSDEPKIGRPNHGNFGKLQQGMLEVSDSQRLRSLIIKLQAVLDQQ